MREKDRGAADADRRGAEDKSLAISKDISGRAMESPGDSASSWRKQAWQSAANPIAALRHAAFNADTALVGGGRGDNNLFVVRWAQGANLVPGRTAVIGGGESNNKSGHRSEENPIRAASAQSVSASHGARAPEPDAE